ncbi:MAG: hypothetical protein D6732_07340, partial [Methanobacteriota archaeon]
QINSLSLTSQDSLHYSGSIPGTGQNSYDVFYRIEATNSFGVTSSFPETGFLSFHVGVDTVPPVIQVSYPDSFAIQQWPLTLQLTVFDNVGVDSVFLYSALNDTSQLIKTQAINVGDDGYEVQFPQTRTLQDNDYIYFKLRAVDAGSQHNVSFAPVAGFYRIRLFKADGYILIVQDDVPDTLLPGKTGSIIRNKAAINASSNAMKNILQRHRFAVDLFSLNDADISSFGKYDLIIHSAGGNTRTLIRDDYRTALQDWILASPSHKCLFEGGELFYNWFAYSFGQDILHIKKWISDDGGELSLKTDLTGYSFLNSPYALPPNIVLTGNGENIRDVVTITSDAVPLYHWQ